MTVNTLSPLLEVSQLTVKFGGLVALNNFSLRVRAGEISGLIGPNGAGKTTVFNLISGVYRPTCGTISASGKTLVGLSANQIALAGVARTFQNIRLFSGLNAFENLIAACTQERKGTLIASLMGVGKIRSFEKNLYDRADEILRFVGLESLRESQSTSLPYGSQRKLEIARALMMKPKLLLLDEPAAGMNPTEKDNLRELVSKIAKTGIGVLVIEHDMKFVMNLCTEITVLDHGEVIACGNAQSVQQNPKVIEAYLGVDLTLPGSDENITVVLENNKDSHA